MRRRLAAIGTGAALLLGTGVMAAPSASATSFCFMSQGDNWGHVDCQTTKPNDRWQLVLVCNWTGNSSYHATVTGAWHGGNGSDTLYCPASYVAAYTNVNNNN